MGTQNKNTFRLKPQEQSEQEIAFLKVLDSRMVGQKAAKAAAARAKRRAGNPLRNQRGPVYKALLIGKSRTGKTLTAETTALSLHGDVNALVRVDCAEYQHGHEVSRLLGAPPSYVGYDAPDGNGDEADKKAKPGKAPTALLARQNLVASRKGSKTPITIILLDEIEKAHTSLKDVLLAIFDKGRIRLANNSETDFTDCIFFLTSNLGMDQLEKLGQSIGFRTQEVKEPTEQDVAEVVGKELKRHFRPEFLKRLDETVIFAPLTQSQLAELVNLELGFVQERINLSLEPNRRFLVNFDAEVQKLILFLTESTEGGVAEVKQIIERELIDILGGELEKDTILPGDEVVIGVEDRSFTFTINRLESPSLANAEHSSKADGGSAGGQQSAESEDGKKSGRSNGNGNGNGNGAGNGQGATPPVSPKLKELRELIAAKLVAPETLEGRQKVQNKIYFGTEIGLLARKYGGQSTDLEAVQRSFMTEDAHKLLWQKTSNAYWFWKIYEGAAKSALALPITTSDVLISLDVIRSLVGIKKVSDKYNPNADTRVNLMRYMQAGVLLLEKPEGETNWKISFNAIYT